MAFSACASDPPAGNDRKLQGHLRIIAPQLFADGRMGGLRAVDDAGGVRIYLEQETPTQNYRAIDSTTTTRGAYSFADVADGNYRVRTWIPADSIVAFTVDATTTSIDTLILGSYTVATTPNPFTDRTDISFDVLSPGAIQVRVQSVDGTINVLLLSALLEAGNHTIRWNGLLPDSTAAPSGPYCVVVSTDIDSRYFFGFKE